MTEQEKAQKITNLLELINQLRKNREVADLKLQTAEEILKEVKFKRDELKTSFDTEDEALRKYIMEYFDLTGDASPAPGITVEKRVNQVFDEDSVLYAIESAPELLTVEKENLDKFIEKIMPLVVINPEMYTDVFSLKKSEAKKNKEIPHSTEKTYSPTIRKG